jgi:hypothetical protein
VRNRQWKTCGVGTKSDGAKDLPISGACEPVLQRLYFALCLLEPRLGSLEAFTNGAYCLLSLRRLLLDERGGGVSVAKFAVESLGHIGQPCQPVIEGLAHLCAARHWHTLRLCGGVKPSASAADGVRASRGRVRRHEHASMFYASSDGAAVNQPAAGQAGRLAGWQEDMGSGDREKGLPPTTVSPTTVSVAC